jgi:single-strand DNA-binding protein
VAVNSRRKDGQSGEWIDKPNYFDVTVWGAQGENCANYLQKGRPVAIEGRLDWREWDDQAGNKRQSVEIIANTVQFLGSRDGAGGGGGGQPPQQNNGGFSPQSDVPADTSDFAGAPSGGNEDDIPF